MEWTERVLVVHSPAYAQAQQRGLERRLERATARLNALIPPRGRGKRQIQQEAGLVAAVEAILHKYQVQGLLSYTFERQVEQQTKYVGRSRGAAERPRRVEERVRYQVTAVVRHEAAITALLQGFGWRAYVTDLPAERLSLSDAVWTYREEWQIERGFHRFKGAPLHRPSLRQTG